MGTPEKGFTLVEIAVVLVIIGLLLGGIIKGQELITQAKIKRVIADLTGVSAAMYAYHDRYGVLPGDDQGAASRWSGANAGNGNGIIEGAYASATPTHESRLFWDHLRRAGFVTGGGTENPSNAVLGKTGVQTGDGAGGGVLGTNVNTQLFTGLLVCSANLPDKIAAAVDSQMDDGRGKTGSVRGKLGMGNPALLANDSADEYVEGVSLYVVCRLINS